MNYTLAVRTTSLAGRVRFFPSFARRYIGKELRENVGRRNPVCVFKLEFLVRQGSALCKRSRLSRPSAAPAP